MCKETMKAVVVPEKVDGSVEVREVPVPAVGHGQALVKIEYSGVCHTDLHVALGDFGEVPAASSVTRASAVSSRSARVLSP